MTPSADQVPVGFSVPPFRRRITREMAITHASPMKNFHTVLEDAQALGYPDIVIAGPMFTCFFSEMLTRCFGEAWLTGGDLRFKLVKPVFAGETVAARATVTAHEAEPERADAVGSGAIQVHLDVWCEREDDGVTTSTGSALVRLPG